jgi:myosin heavy subunit
VQVCYSVDGLLDKNNDTLHEDLIKLLSSSKSAAVQQLMELRATKLSVVVDKATANRRASVGAQASNANSSRFQSRSTEFARQLQTLVADLNETTSHFIRCIKPNQVQQPAVVNRTHVLGQMRHGGLMSALAMMHSGYPTRCPYDTIYKRFNALLSTTGAMWCAPRMASVRARNALVMQAIRAWCGCNALHRRTSRMRSCARCRSAPTSISSVRTT